jgi:hypothetical protein
MEDSVKALNNYVRNNYGLSGTFVIYKSYSVDKKFSIFRHYKMCLYYVNNGNETPIIEEEMTVKADTLNLEKLLNIKFLEAIYDYVDSDEFKDLTDGKLGI